MPDIAGSFQKGFGLTDNLMNQILGRNQLKQKTAHDEAALKQMESHFQQNFGLSKAAAGRAAQAAADAHKLALQKQDPLFEAKQYAALEDYWRNKGNPGMQQGANPAEQQPQPTQEMGEGMGMYSPEGMQEAQQQPMQQQAPQTQQQQNTNNPMGIDLELMKQHPMLRGWYKKHYGVDPLAAVPQTPAEKMADKFQMEDYKTEKKKALEETKAELKNKATQQKVVDSAKNDLPNLELTLRALETMQKIAKNNPDMFGHSGVFGIGADKAAERFAKTSKNPNVGAWQTYGLGPIIASEMKMSARGNQLALKTALANKPNFSESQEVAQSKIDSSIREIKEKIAENRKLTGDKKNDNEQVMVIRPDGKMFKTTKENAAHLPTGWKHG